MMELFSISEIIIAMITANAVIHGKSFPHDCCNELVFSLITAIVTIVAIIAELHPRAKRARGRSPIAKEMW